MLHKSHQLELVALHLSKEIVDRRRTLIARLKAEGSSTDEHESLLAVFNGSLKILEEHERELRKGWPAD